MGNFNNINYHDESEIFQNTGFDFVNACKYGDSIRCRYYLYLYPNIVNFNECAGLMGAIYHNQLHIVKIFSKYFPFMSPYCKQKAFLISCYNPRRRHIGKYLLNFPEDFDCDDFYIAMFIDRIIEKDNIFAKYIIRKLEYLEKCNKINILVLEYSIKNRNTIISNLLINKEYVLNKIMINPRRILAVAKIYDLKIYKKLIYDVNINKSLILLKAHYQEDNDINNYLILDIIKIIIKFSVTLYEY
jgi:hypothetical protein